jgi:hypothetical protein
MAEEKKEKGLINVAGRKSTRLVLSRVLARCGSAARIETATVRIREEITEPHVPGPRRAFATAEATYPIEVSVEWHVRPRGPRALRGVRVERVGAGVAGRKRARDTAAIGRAAS